MSDISEPRVYKAPLQAPIKDWEVAATALILSCQKHAELECKMRGIITEREFDEVFHRHVKCMLTAACLLAKNDVETFRNARSYIRKVGLRYDLVV